MCFQYLTGSHKGRYKVPTEGGVTRRVVFGSLSPLGSLSRLLPPPALPTASS